MSDMSERPGPRRIGPPPPSPPAAPASPARGRRPGPAVVLILIYGAAFGAGLWWIRARSPLFRDRRPGGAASPAAEAKSPSLPGVSSGPAPAPISGATARRSVAADPAARRAALLAGDGLAASALLEYERRISTEKCTCGCGLPLRKCLAQDRSCARSPELAEKIQASLR